jgi:hypothetical protein
MYALVAWNGSREGATSSELAAAQQVVLPVERRHLQPVERGARPRSGLSVHASARYSASLAK